VGAETEVIITIRLLFVFSCLAMVAALHGAGAAEGAEFSELGGTYWRLTSIDEAAYVSKVIVRVTKSTIDFSAPCHFALYGVDDVSGSLSFSNGPAVIRPCWGAKWFFRDALEATLLRIRRHTVNGDDLTFLDARDRSVMVLRRITAKWLENRAWSIAQYLDGAVLVAPKRSASIAFMNGFVDGMSGCEMLTGQYRVGRARLMPSISLWGSGYCSGDYEQQMQQATGVFNALSGERLVASEGDNVILRDDQGATRVVLRPKVIGKPSLAVD
jgi:heat shock protein HslJ